MTKIYSKVALSLIVSAFSWGGVNAQTTTTKYAEKVTAVTPLKVTSGFNADIIAEKKATSKTNYTTQKSGGGNYSTTTYTSKLATMIDGDNDHGRSAFFTIDVQEEGAIKYKDGYLDGNIDSYGTTPLKYKLAAATEQNALLLTDTEKSGTLTLTPAVENATMPATSMVYLLATSAEGASTVKVTIYGSDGTTVLGTETATIGDWFSGHATTKLTQVYETLRISVKGESTEGKTWGYMNYVNKGVDEKNGSFWLQRIGVSTDTDQPIGKITIEKTNTGSNAVIMAVTGVTEEVTLEETETSLDYLQNESTHQRIAEGTKYKVHFNRTFTPEKWNALIFNCSLSAAEAKAMFGQNIKISVANESSYQGNRVIFYPVTLDDNSEDYVIEPGKYYLINGVTIPETKNQDGTATYSGSYIHYFNPAKTTTDASSNETKEFSTAPNDYTVTNEKGSTITFHGTYVAETQLPQYSYALSTDGKFYRYTDTPKIKGFRFWFTAQDNEGNAAKETTFSMEVADGSTTGITLIGGDGQHKPANNNVYTLDGRIARSQSTSTEGLAKGLYIVNGKKVIVK